MHSCDFVPAAAAATSLLTKIISLPEIDLAKNSSYVSSAVAASRGFMSLGLGSRAPSVQEAVGPAECAQSA
jgi:hypothetical protein